MKQKLQLLPSRIRLLLGIIGVILCAGKAQAQTTLAAGDLAITSFNATNAATLDSFSFVLLANISSGTNIKFTDKSYLAGAWTSVSTDGTISWTSGSALAAGTEVVIANLNSAYVASTGVANGTVTAVADGGNAMSLSNNGDQIIAYQGSGLINGGGVTIIFALHYNYCSFTGGTTDAGWDISASCGGQNSSQIPPGTTSGVSAFWTGTVPATTTPPSSGKFNCAGMPVGTAAAVRTAVCNAANWTKNFGGAATTVGVPAGCMFIGATAPVITTQPTNKAICVNSGTTYTVAATGSGLSYQWKVSTTGTGGSYTNVSGGNYSGGTTATLTLSSVPATFNGYAYRCDVTNSGGTVNSNEATLAVSNGVPVVSTQPSDAFICPNGNTSFTVASSGPSLTYQWQVNTGGGFTDVSSTGIYTNANTNTLTLTGAPVANYGYQYRCVVTNSCGSTNSNAATLRFGSTWTGGVNSNWDVAGNWSCGVPTTSLDARIVVAGTPPSVNVTTAVCRNLSIASGATLSMNASTALAIAGGLTNLGTFNASATSAVVNFTSTDEQTIGGGSYYNLTISGGGTKNLGGSVTAVNNVSLSSGKLQLGANNITVGGTVTGNVTNYIVTNGTGGLTINNIGAGGKTGIILFPIGPSASVYNRVRLQNSGTADNFTARVINGVYRNYIGNTPVGAPISDNVVNKTWFVSEQTAGGSDATLYVFWDDADELGTFDNTAVTLSHYTAGGWDPMTLTVPVGGSPYEVSRANITSFSPFGVGNANSPLPVTWKNFSGRSEGQSVVLDWAVADEKDVVKYDVQRSENGRDFSVIGSEKAKGDAGMHAYTFTDRNIAAPVYYYRIRMTETSGASSFSSVVRIATRAENKIRLLSNPVVQDIKLELNAVADGSVSVKVADLNGRKVLSQVIAVQPGTRIVSIPAAGLIDGQVYFLDVQGSLGNYTFKVLK